ncbi:hypothetical protein DUI87_05959 [Hirundo rustica rustica]|uniref:Uncharacterized protein n=1 Tax=Hirundo rustica rustica TaxID=333673 RepID=A0A3M0KVX6_HIRRU|nr:hypothetical protein DUI87_05959 [Hirundo rustica rustica]
MTPQATGRLAHPGPAAQAPVPDVFLAKLLKRLYGESSSSSLVHASSREEEVVLENLGTKSKEKNFDNVQISSTDSSTSTNTPCKSSQGKVFFSTTVQDTQDAAKFGAVQLVIGYIQCSTPDLCDDDAVKSPKRIYTVDLPPEGYVAVTPDALSNAVSENSSSSADSTGTLYSNEDTQVNTQVLPPFLISHQNGSMSIFGAISSHVSFESTEEEYQGQTKRKRIRRKKQKSSLQISSNLHGEQTDLGMQATVQDNLQLQQTDSPKISKNKKRKMKKKRQKEKKRAAGFLTKTTSVDFTYQPDKNNKEEEADLKDIGEKAESILDFLQATQQIYFADSMYTLFPFFYECYHAGGNGYAFITAVKWDKSTEVSIVKRDM